MPSWNSTSDVLALVISICHHEPAGHNQDVRHVGDVLDVEGVHVMVRVDHVGQGVDVERLLEASGDESAGGRFGEALGHARRIGSTSMPNSFFRRRREGSPGLRCFFRCREAHTFLMASKETGFAQSLPCFDPGLHGRVDDLARRLSSRSSTERFLFCGSAACRAASNDALE